MIIFILTLTVVPAYALKTVKVKAEYVYYAPENISVEAAKRIALERAQLQAIADEFGTLVSQNTSMTMQSGKINFASIGGTEVKGEWIETTREPEYDILYEDGKLIVGVSLEGKIREYATEMINLKCMTLKNGTEEKNASTDFNSGDDLYLLFQSPKQGYLLIYLIDETEKTAYQMLPYSTSTDDAWIIRNDLPHILFSIEKAPEAQKMYVDEYVLTSKSELSYNDLYILFSTAPITRTVASKTGEKANLPKQLSVADFRKWLSKNRASNEKLNVVTIPLTIHGR